MLNLFNKTRYFHICYKWEMQYLSKEGFRATMMTTTRNSFVDVDQISKSIECELQGPVNVVICNWNEINKKEYEYLKTSYEIQNKRLADAK